MCGHLGSSPALKSFGFSERNLGGGWAKRKSCIIILVNRAVPYKIIFLDIHLKSKCGVLKRLGLALIMNCSLLMINYLKHANLKNTNEII